MYKLLMIAGILLATSCNSNTGKTNKTESANTTTETDAVKTKPTETKTPPASIEGCYMQVLSRDTFAASFQQQGNSITGKLSFDNFEKDGSTGTVNGLIENEIVKLLYSFASEGTNSVMEVYFKYDNGKLLRGTGDMDTKGDTAYFKDPSTIKYDGSAFQKLSCTNLPAKYK